jgi:hypothetical protein
VLLPGGSFLLADLRTSDGLDALREQFHASHLNLEHEDDISANVLMALRLDNDRKLQLIQDLIPWPFRRPFRAFAGIEGTTNYLGFENGSELPRVREWQTALRQRPPHQEQLVPASMHPANRASAIAPFAEAALSYLFSAARAGRCCARRNQLAMMTRNVFES